MDEEQGISGGGRHRTGSRNNRRPNLDMSGLDSREVEKIVDQPGKTIRIGFDASEVADLFLVQRPRETIEHIIHGSLDRRQWAQPIRPSRARPHDGPSPALGSRFHEIARRRSRRGPGRVGGTSGVREGLGVAFIRYSKAYVAEEATARSAQQGMWAGAFIAPWDWRHRRAQLEC